MIAGRHPARVIAGIPHLPLLGRRRRRRSRRKSSGGFRRVERRRRHRKLGGRRARRVIALGLPITGKALLGKRGRRPARPGELRAGKQCTTDTLLGAAVIAPRPAVDCIIALEISRGGVTLGDLMEDGLDEAAGVGEAVVLGVVRWIQ